MILLSDVVALRPSTLACLLRQITVLRNTFRPPCPLTRAAPYTENTCTCDGGTPSVGSGSAETLCDTNGQVDCSSCNEGYTISAPAAAGSAQICEAIICAVDQYVSSHACVDCALGTTNGGCGSTGCNHDASGSDTECDTTLCLENEYVSEHECVACASGTAIAAGSPASGDNNWCCHDFSTITSVETGSCTACTGPAMEASSPLATECTDATCATGYSSYSSGACHLGCDGSIVDGASVFSFDSDATGTTDAPAAQEVAQTWHSTLVFSCSAPVFVGTVTYTCGEDGTFATNDSCTAAWCTTPTAADGYDTSGESGPLAIGDFQPSGVTCAPGLTGPVVYDVCSANGLGYSLSGCTDVTAPTLTLVSIASGNTDPTVGANGDVITLTLQANEDISVPTVAFLVGGEAVPGADCLGSTTTTYTCTYTVSANDNGAVTFSVDFTDTAGPSSLVFISSH